MALVATLLVVTLLTILVVEFTYSIQVESQLARNSLSSLQASYLARSGINILAGALVVDETPTEDPSLEDLEGWGSFVLRGCSPLPALELPPYWELCVRIVDESGKLNVNNTKPLRVTDLEATECQFGNHVCWREALRRLVAPAAGEEFAEELDARLAEYWEANFVEEEPGRPPTPPRDFDSIQDFAAAFPDLWENRDGYRVLKEFATALPLRGSRRTPVNVNSAPAEVLQAILDDPAVVDEILARQKEEPFRSGELPEGVEPSMRPLLGTSSSLFRLEASASVNGVGKTIRTLARRLPSPRRAQGGPAWELVFVDWHKEGGVRLFREAAEAELGPEGEGLVSPENSGMF
ncbi:MAG: hypothetical protein KatS3mg076_0123 [Candidatus Binatia bacterium]|nr:MAG: hypothetical protein KatS3mg076_0123 [Candidatus Binatia bacterium]